MKKLICVVVLSTTASFGFAQLIEETTTNVGIGTNTPSGGLLHIYKNATTGGWGFINTSNAGLRIQDNGASLFIDGNTLYTSSSMNIGTITNSHFTIGTYDSERIRIQGNGNVGIGTNNPIGKLDIKGLTYLKAAPTHSTISEQLRIGRSDLDIRYHSIFSNHSGDADENYLQFRIHTGNSSNTTEQISAMTINGLGNIGIGTTETFGYKLAVNGTIGSKEVKVENTSAWPDFVFEKEYELRTLEEVDEYIHENKHLPEIPSELEVTENGINLGDMDSKLLQKIEELTLYLIEQNKEIKELKEKVQRLENE